MYVINGSTVIVIQSAYFQKILIFISIVSIGKMGCSFKRKSDKGLFSKKAMQDAVNLVIKDKESLWDAADAWGIKYQTLRKYIHLYIMVPMHYTFIYNISITHNCNL